MKPDLEILFRKTIILDTNVLIDSYKHLKEYKDLFDELSALSVTYVLTRGIQMEYLRSSSRSEELAKRKLWLTTLSGSDDGFAILPEHTTPKSAFDEGEKMSQLMHHINRKTSFVDCLLAGQLKLRPNSSYLLTANNKDFPVELFDRVKIFTLEIGNDIIPVSIYGFSLEKYESLLAKFDAVTR